MSRKVRFCNVCFVDYTQFEIPDYVSDDDMVSWCREYILDNWSKLVSEVDAGGSGGYDFDIDWEYVSD